MNNLIIHKKYSRWKQQYLLTFICFLVCAMVSFKILSNWGLINIFTVSILILLIGFFTVRFYQHRPRLRQLLNALNAENPELEFSSSIMIRDEKTLNPLERLQVNKIEERLTHIKWNPAWNQRLLLNSVASLVLLTFFGFVSSHLSPTSKNIDSKVVAESKNSSLNEEIVMLENTSVTVTPPSYVLSSVRSYGSGPLKIPEGSNIKWQLKFNQEPDSVSISISGKQHSLKGSRHYEEVFHESSFYQFTYGNTPSYEISEYYPITVIKDEKPVIDINGIKEYTLVDYDSTYLIQFNVEIKDDYLIDDAYILATVAKGSGESVKFRERRIDIPGFVKGKKMNTTCSLNTQDLDMEPGSELYFYVSAKDNCPFRNNKSKSLTYIFVFKDTVSYNAWDDGGMQVDLMPDFFRSQRQIIIDTEQLLKDQSRISSWDFNRRSNELGFDQKQLRLKYGQFLGEESESGIAIEPEIDESEDHDHDHENPLPGENRVLDWGREVLEQFGHDHDHENEEGQRFEEAGTTIPEDPARPSWVEELSHNHDNAEMNTYFELPIKSKLKAALSQMWDSELHLRLYDPESSLPYQYKALKLLQEIKDHARIYVHRLGFDPPPIKEEKRLSGELNEITSSEMRMEVDGDKLVNYLRDLSLSLSAINLQNGQKLPFDVKSKLKNLGDQISGFASARLELLPLLTSLQDLIQSEEIVAYEDVVRIQNEILKMIPGDQQSSIRNRQMAISEVKSKLIDLSKSSGQ